MTRASRVAVVLGTTLLWGCATGAPPNPTQELRAAVADLEQDEFGPARAALLDALSPCTTGPDGRRALLVLAAADLDPANPDGSPNEAALAAARYLSLDAPSPHERVLARALFRLALDRGGSAEPSGSGRTALGAAECGSQQSVAGRAPLPAAPKPSTVDRMRALQRRARIQADSLEALEAEIQRITHLLTDGAHAPSGGAEHR